MKQLTLPNQARTQKLARTEKSVSEVPRAPFNGAPPKKNVSQTLKWAMNDTNQAASDFTIVKTRASAAGKDGLQIVLYASTPAGSPAPGTEALDSKIVSAFRASIGRYFANHPEQELEGVSQTSTISVHAAN